MTLDARLKRLERLFPPEPELPAPEVLQAESAERDLFCRTVMAIAYGDDPPPEATGEILDEAWRWAPCLQCVAFTIPIPAAYWCGGLNPCRQGTAEERQARRVYVNDMVRRFENELDALLQEGAPSSAIRLGGFFACLKSLHEVPRDVDERIAQLAEACLDFGRERSEEQWDRVQAALVSARGEL